MTDRLTDHATAQEAFLAALQETGDRQAAADQVGLSARTLRDWMSRDPELRADVAFVLEQHRARFRRKLIERLADVALNGFQETQTHNGRVVHELDRHPDGQPILDPMRDASGDPVLDAEGQPVKLVPRLKIDEVTREPIPVVVRRYCKATTLRVAEQLQVLEAEGGERADGGKDVVLVDDSGKRISLSDALRARFEATRPRIVDAETE